ncbi:hypothetical protein [Arthrobacter sp. Br18]|uniref:hypothetical protein n=1 Tax=Arthrobacter sp. Br18 TaxID=1312954 RepID=UPI0012DCD10B|nr:hypothetical protein [Arthrobacter sp. Br18]
MTTVDQNRAVRRARGIIPLTVTGEVPWCQPCNTADYLIFEEYVPARVGIGHGRRILGSASYSCSACGSFSAHSVPETWSPPRWFWYT